AADALEEHSEQRAAVLVVVDEQDAALRARRRALAGRTVSRLMPGCRAASFRDTPAVAAPIGRRGGGSLRFEAVSGPPRRELVERNLGRVVPQGIHERRAG